MIESFTMPDTILSRISDHIYWMPPGKPDRPSLCAVVGAEHTLMLDVGSSATHTHLFLEALRAEGIPVPHYAALTHWHWDHVFGASELNVPLIAQSLTAAKVAALAGRKWDDAALDDQTAAGTLALSWADNIKLELPEPREVRIVRPDIVFQDKLDIHLGGVTCRIQHVGGDHADDSCVMFIEPDHVLFLGDCLYDGVCGESRCYTMKRLFPLLDTLLGFGVEQMVEGHTPEVMTRAAFESLAANLRLVGQLVEQHGTDETTVLAAAQTRTGAPPDADMMEFVRAFIAGRKYEG
jgi:glyoxylase-like metal-dependent hydrolase (beta-lactamase superfamily II)